MKNITFVIGRKPQVNKGEVPIFVNDENKFVNFSHAKLIFQDGFFYIEDLNSKNGTFVNGQKIYTRTKVDMDDDIYLGKNYKFSLNNPFIENAIMGKYNVQTLSSTTRKKKTGLKSLSLLENIFAVIVLIINLFALFLFDEITSSSGFMFTFMVFVITYLVGFGILAKYLNINNFSTAHSLLQSVLVISAILIGIFIFVYNNERMFLSISASDAKALTYFLGFVFFVVELMYFSFALSLLSEREKLKSVLITVFAVFEAVLHFVMLAVFLYGIYLGMSNSSPVKMNMNLLENIDSFINILYVFSILALTGFFVEQLIKIEQKKNNSL